MVFKKEISIQVVLERLFRFFDNPKEYFGLKNLDTFVGEDGSPVSKSDYLKLKEFYELDKITLAPLLPGNIYLFFVHAWDFLILEWSVKIIFASILGALSVRAFRLGVQMDFVGILSQYSFWVVCYVISWLVIKVWEMLVLNRLAWNRLAWESFEKYRQSSRNWNTVTIVYFGAIAVFLIWMAIAFMF